MVVFFQVFIALSFTPLPVRYCKHHHLSILSVQYLIKAYMENGGMSHNYALLGSLESIKGG